MKLEQFAEDVVESVYGDKMVNLKADPTNVVDVLKIVEIIGQLIADITANCPNKDNLKEIAKNPSYLHRVKFRRMMKDLCDCETFSVRNKYSKLVDACLDKASRMEDESLQDILDEVSSVNNWLI
jgi:hypothetical protein